MSNSAHAYLVESIPKGLEELRGTPGVAYTEDVLVQLTSRAKSSIDLTAMYWALLANPSSDDEKGFTPEQLDAMGAGAGRALYEAVRAAAQRGVCIRKGAIDGVARRSVRSRQLLALGSGQVGERRQAGHDLQ